MLRAAIAQIVAVHTRYYDIRQTQKTYCFCQMPRLLEVRSQRPAVGDVAERAAARADVAEDHEGGRALAEALGDVRTRGFLANRVQLLLAQDALDVVEARVRTCRAHANPGGLGQWRLRDDADRLARAALFYAGFTHRGFSSRIEPVDRP